MEPLSANDPRTVGDFQLRARLGAGGMGRVYLGVSPGGRAVAVKVVHPELASDQAFIRRFRQEVAAARAVSGMYTAPVVSAGLDADPPWLATVFVPGPSLDGLIRSRGPLPEPAVWRLAAGLAEALRAVHACGLVHRDLKPANVLLAADGPHLIDFGISRALDGTSLTATGMVFGTPGYMSPEQAEGDRVGPASDVFSLGTVLAYAATGNPPFGAGTAAAVLYRVVTAQPDLTGIPGRLREVVASCLEKNPAARPSPAALQAVIAAAAPGGLASASSFWPTPVAETIRALAAGARQQNGAGPVGARTLTAERPTPAAPRPAPVAAAASRGAGGRGLLARRAIPAPVRVAVRLMYAGAALSLVNTILSLAIIGQVKTAFLAQHPGWALGTVRAAAGIAASGVAFGGIVSIALWLWLASASKQGRSWARTTGTVLFGINTLTTLATAGRPGIPATKAVSALIWLAGLAAVIALWQRGSRRYLSGTRYR